MESDWSHRLNLAQEVVESTLKLLPPDLCSAVRQIAVSFQPNPSPEQIADGIEVDTLGLFVGEAFTEILDDGCPLPSQVILYLDNLWDFAGGDTKAYQVEIRTTLLHELGHYLGLDETDLEARGLE